MKQRKILNLLESLGLTDNEAEVYLAALSHGSCTVLDLSRATSIKRTTIYTAIDALKSKGLIMIEVKGFKKRFVAENPQKLYEMVEENKRNLENLMPSLQALQKLTHEASVIKYYEGLASIKSVYEQLLEDLKNSKTYYVFANQEFWYSLDSIFFQDFIERRAAIAKEAKVKIKLLLKDSLLTRKHVKLQDAYEETIKVLPKTAVFETNTVITDKRVVFHQLKEQQIAIVIENPSVILMHQELFKILWKLV